MMAAQKRDPWGKGQLDLFGPAAPQVQRTFGDVLEEQRTRAKPAPAKKAPAAKPKRLKVTWGPWNRDGSVWVRHGQTKPPGATVPVVAWRLEVFPTKYPNAYDVFVMGRDATIRNPTAKKENVEGITNAKAWAEFLAGKRRKAPGGVSRETSKREPTQAEVDRAVREAEDRMARELGFKSAMHRRAAAQEKAHPLPTRAEEQRQEIERRKQEQARQLYVSLIDPDKWHHWTRFELSHTQKRPGTERELADIYARHRKDPNRAAELVGPIKVHVYPGPKGAVAEVVDGVHRFRAAKRYGANRVPAEVYRYLKPGVTVDHHVVKLGLVPRKGKR